MCACYAEQCRTVGTTEAAPNAHKSASTGEVQNERGKYRRQRADAVYYFSLTSFGFLVEEGSGSIENPKEIW